MRGVKAGVEVVVEVKSSPAKEREGECSLSLLMPSSAASICGLASARPQSLTDSYCNFDQR